jgi:hypothetical protein
MERGRSMRSGGQLYWLLRTSVRERDLLGYHHHPLSLCQVVLSHRSRRGMVLVHKGKHTWMGSRLSEKPCKCCRYCYGTWWIIRPAPSERISGWVSPQSMLQRGCFIPSVNAPVPLVPSPNRLLLLEKESSRVVHAPMRTHGTGDKGWHSTSRAVHRRVVLPAAIAGVRWRYRCATILPPRSRGCASATRSAA